MRTSPHRNQRTVHIVILFSLLSCLGGGQVLAALPNPLAKETPAPEPSQQQLSSARTVVPPQPIPNDAIVSRLDGLRRLTQPILDQPENPQVKELELNAARLLALADDTLRTTKMLLQGTPTSQALSDLGAELRILDSRLDTLLQGTEPLVHDTQQLLATLERELHAWQLTRERPEFRSVPRQLRAEVQDALHQVSQVRDLTRQQLDRQLIVIDRLNRRNTAIAELQVKLAEAGSQFRKSLLVPEAVPLWELFGAVRATPAVKHEQHSLSFDQSLAITGDYLNAHQKEIGAFFAFFVFILACSFLLRHHVLAWASEHPDFRETSHFLTRPVSLTLLVTVTIYPLLILPGAPRLLLLLFGLLLLVPLLRILPPLFSPSLRPLLFVVAFFYVAQGLRGVLIEDLSLSRWSYVVTNLLAIAIVVVFFHPARLRRFPLEEKVPPFLLLVSRGAIGLLVLSLLANLFGFFDLAQVLTRGIINTVFVALVLYGTAMALVFVLEALLETRRLQSLATVQLNRLIIIAWGSRLIRLLALAFWIRFALRAFSLHELVLGGIWEALTAPIFKGRISFSVWDILSFGIVLTAAIVTAKIIRSLLREDMLPRLPLAKGVPTLLSTMVFYSLLLLGFILALGFAGVDFNKITLLTGAFGVGIGFGLQTIVNNFISGLILLFERPIHVGDVVEVGGLLGEVQNIGTRASTIRTYEGAEVIVPNATLITDKLINWTLSEQRRRVDIKIGVAYGSDPRRVLEILREAGSGNPYILPEIAPVVLFTGFGESSLDFELRVWTDFAYHMVVRSDLNTAINQALAEAGIEIPFPQRDVHIRSMEGTPAKEFATKPGKGNSESVARSD